MNMIVLLTTLCVVLMTFVGQGYAVILTIDPVASNATVFTGNELVQLNCTSDTPAATIQWNYNGIALPPNHATITVDSSFTISTLTLIDPAPDKSGEYSCFVPLTFSTSVSTTLDIFAPIYLINSSPRISALVGDTVTMRVSSLGLGQHTRRWSRRGRNVIKEDATGVDTVQLTLPNVSIADAGRYLFTATTQWSTNRTRVELTVTYPPADITEQPKNRSVFVSLSATFHCGASSLYPVIYSWQRVDSSVNITSQAIGLNTSTLVIPSVQYSDEGLYQCVTSVFGVESSSEPAYLTVKELPSPRDLKVKMNVDQNQVMLDWTRPNAEVISSNLTLSYKLFYTVKGVCAISTCRTEMCRVQRRIRGRQNSVTFNQELFPYANYSWLLELTYTNDGLTIERYNISVDAQTSQSGASAPVNLTVLDQSFRSVNLTWTTPQCPNGVISGYRVFYNDSFTDVSGGIMDHYILSGLTANTVYNISVAAITGDNNDIIGDYISVTTMTSLGAPEISIQLQGDGLPIAVTRNVTRGTIEVRTPPVSDARGNISFIYIIVSSDGMVRPDKSTENLAYLDAIHSGLVYYVAAALSYREYSDSNTFTLGNAKITTGLNGQIFKNVKLNTNTAYHYFIRAYSLYYNEQNGLVSTSALYDIGSLPSDTANVTATVNDDGDDDGFPATIAIAILAGLVAMIVVLMCIIIFCCYYVISRNNRIRRNIQRDLQKPVIMKEDTMDSGASAKPDTTPKAVPNQYKELLVSITDKDVQPYAEVHQNNGGLGVANGNTRAVSNSPCSVTSDDANEKINPALGISEQKEKATIEEKEKAKDSETDHPPSQETSGYVNVPDKSTPKKESKHSWFSFRSRKKSKSGETKTAQSDNTNPVFDQKEVDSEETGYIDIVVEQLDNTAEVSGYAEVVREAQDTKEEPGYSNVTKTDTEEVPGYGNITLELSDAKITDNSNNSITQTVHTNEENA